jgi:hypothetical protein
MNDTAGSSNYGTPEHAATEALNEAATDSWVQGPPEDIAELVVHGLRERGFFVAREPRCECGWTGMANHLHDDRMGRANA